MHTIHHVFQEQLAYYLVLRLNYYLGYNKTPIISMR